MTTPRYLTVNSYKAWANDDTSADDTLIEEAINASEEWLDEQMGRSLVLIADLEAATATAKTFRPDQHSSTLRIRDAAEITSVVENGVTLTEGTHYVGYPYDNEHPTTGAYRPFDRIYRLDTCWYTDGHRATVTVTAKWGWTSIPAAVVTAARVLTSDWLANRQVRLGVVGSTADGFSIGVRENPNVLKAIRTVAGINSVMVA